MSRLSDAREVLELSVHIEPVHSDDGVGALLNEAAGLRTGPCIVSGSL